MIHLSAGMEKTKMEMNFRLGHTFILARYISMFLIPANNNSNLKVPFNFFGRRAAVHFAF